MKEKKKYLVWKGNKYGQYGSVNLFVEWRKREIDGNRSDTIGIWDLPKGGSQKGLAFDIKHLDKVIKILKKIKKRYESKDE